MNVAGVQDRNVKGIVSGIAALSPRLYEDP